MVSAGTVGVLGRLPCTYMGSTHAAVIDLGRTFINRLRDSGLRHSTHSTPLRQAAAIVHFERVRTYLVRIIGMGSLGTHPPTSHQARFSSFRILVEASTAALPKNLSRLGATIASSAMMMYLNRATQGTASDYMHHSVSGGARVSRGASCFEFGVGLFWGASAHGNTTRCVRAGGKGGKRAEECANNGPKR